MLSRAAHCIELPLIEASTWVECSNSSSDSAITASNWSSSRCWRRSAAAHQRTGPRQHKFSNVALSARPTMVILLGRRSSFGGAVKDLFRVWRETTEAEVLGCSVYVSQAGKVPQAARIGHRATQGTNRCFSPPEAALEITLVAMKIRFMNWRAACI